MILNTDKPVVLHGGTPIRRINMNDMDAESIAVMVENSRDGFYSNKILAPIREYSTNAQDSHTQSGIPTRPIEITLPTILEPELKIRDFGAGLTIDQMTDVYFKYWKSTKRGNNLENGCLGIGAKSAFAYAPIYTVISWCGGMKTVATGQKDGFADIICHQPNIDNEEQGVEVIIPIQQKDIENFINEALQFFKYWDIKPIFHNADDERVKGTFAPLEIAPFLSGNGWSVRPAGYGNGHTKAVMSFVPYNIDWEQVKSNLTPEIRSKISGIFTFLQENITTLTFNNGSLAFTPNRESLQYNDVTVNELSNKLVEIYNSLLNLITEKITDAPNLWEAKIRYNQIFRKEFDGFDKSISYAGNLSTIEHLLSGRIQWNGITITNGMFEELDSWDITAGKVGSYHNGGFTPILTIYVKDDSKTSVKAVRTSSRRRWNSANNKIICSPKSVVVIQDTDKNVFAKGYARWLFYKSGKDISQVYVLDLSNPTVKADFYKNYNFDTVPVSVISSNELLIKAYLKSIRAPRNSSTGKADRERGSLNCPFIDITNRRVSTYVSMPNWGYEDVNAKGLETGGYFVVYSKDGFTFNNRMVYHSESRNFWQAIYDLAKFSGETLPKVYGIHPKTANSEWFKEAVEDGEWINLSEFVKENIESLPKDNIKKTAAYINSNLNRVGFSAAEILSPLLIDNNGLAAKYFAEVLEYSKNWSIKDIPTHLFVEGFLYEATEVDRISTLNNQMKEKYPLMFKTSSNKIITNISTGGYKLPADTAKELAQYVNLVDCYA